MIFKEGEKSTALCERCQDVVSTTFKIRNVPLSDKSKIIKNILVSVCDNCDETVAIPHQSLAEIKNQRDKL